MMLGPEYGPEVLAQKSRDMAATLGAAPRPFDEAYRYEWDNGLFEWFSSQPGARELEARSWRRIRRRSASNTARTSRR